MKKIHFLGIIVIFFPLEIQFILFLIGNRSDSFFYWDCTQLKLMADFENKVKQSN